MTDGERTGPPRISEDGNPRGDRREQGRTVTSRRVVTSEKSKVKSGGRGRIVTSRRIVESEKLQVESGVRLCEASEAVAIQSQSFANDVTRKSWMPGRSPA